MYVFSFLVNYCLPSFAPDLVSKRQDDGSDEADELVVPKEDWISDAANIRQGVGI